MKKQPKKFQKKKKIVPQQIVKARVIKFPSISLIFPDYRRISSLVISPVFIVNFIAGFVVMAIALAGISLRSHYMELLRIQSMKEQVQHEYQYWQGVVRSHGAYRDGYFHLATIAYRLGKLPEARSYIKETLTLDPLFQPAVSLAEEIEK